MKIHRQDIGGTSKIREKDLIMHRQTALAFVRANGDPIEQARLHSLLTQECPTSVVMQQVFTGQREDGGWSPFWAPDDSSLDATCFRLAQAEQLGIPE